MLFGDRKYRDPTVRWLRWSVTLLLMFCCAACTSNQEYEQIYKSHPALYSKLIPKYFDELFKPKTKNRLRLIETYERKVKDTVCNFMYDGKYMIQVYKLSENYHLSLEKSLKETYHQNWPEVKTSFYTNQRSQINIFDRMIISEKDRPSQIFLSLNGNNIKSIKNDSLADFYLNFKDLSIGYNTKGRQEIFAEIGRSSDPVPLEMLFLKKKNKLYWLLISPEKSSSLPPAILLDLIAK